MSASTEVVLRAILRAVEDAEPAAYAFEDLTPEPGYEPLTADVVYEVCDVPETSDNLPYKVGRLLVNGACELRSEVFTASSVVVEEDVCSCGSPGCGVFDVRLHRSGPYVLATHWERRTREAAPRGRHPSLPLVLSAASLERAVGGSAATLPPVDPSTLATVLRGLPPAGARVLWQDLPYQLAAEPLFAALGGARPGWLEGAELVPPPADARHGLVFEDGLEPKGARGVMPLFGKGTARGCLALRLGAIARFEVYLRLPGLRS